MINIPAAILLMLLPMNLPASNQDDADQDGLPNEIEQQLLVKFAPGFMVNAKECDKLPAEFQPGAEHPLLLARNGTIYGQVTPARLAARDGAFIEIHYYHLWARDCGPKGHDLDAEHVSALISATALSDPVEAWKAVYWYAAAHEDTLCDASHGARASAINAESRGPIVWISKGKHASFLYPSLCNGGCGSDSCSDMKELAIPKLVNLGESDAAMNGAVWAASTAWPLAEKMRTDFSDETLARLDAAVGTDAVPINEAQGHVQSALHAAGNAAGAASASDQKADAAVKSAAGTARRSLSKAKNKSGSSIKRALKAVWGAVSGN